MSTENWFYSPELYTYKSYVEELQIDWVEYELIYRKDKINTIKVNELFIDKDFKSTVSEIRLNNNLDNPNTKLVYTQPFTQIQHEISLNNYFPSRTLISKFNKDTELMRTGTVEFKDNYISNNEESYCLAVNTTLLHYIQNTTEVEIILINKLENKLITLPPQSNRYHFLKAGSNWQVQLNHYDYDNYHYYPEVMNFINTEIRTYKPVISSILSKASLCLSHYTYTTKLSNSCIEVGINNIENNKNITKVIYTPVITEFNVAVEVDTTALLSAAV